MRAATAHETLQVLHTLWIGGRLSSYEVKKLLWQAYGLELTVLSNSEIRAESKDGNTKYSIG
tara:strand:+ start:1848 stop:2033 length:186 start_codon:yes stop_codon:yes gene_type:complete